MTPLDRAMLNVRRSEARMRAIANQPAMGITAFVESDISTWTPADHMRLVAEGEPLMRSSPGTAENARFIELLGLIEAYEHIHIPVGEPSA